jgi:hypothetical protein
VTAPGCPQADYVLYRYGDVAEVPEAAFNDAHDRLGLGTRVEGQFPADAWSCTPAPIRSDEVVVFRAVRRDAP